MHSLSELKDFLISKQIEIKEFNGWSLKVDTDTWVMQNGIFYRNGMPQNIKDKDLLSKYKTNSPKDAQIARKWKGINSGRVG